MLERYWIPESPSTDSSIITQKANLSVEKKFAMYTEAWHPIELNEIKHKPSKILILSDDPSNNLIKELEKSFDSMEVVVPKGEFPKNLKDVGGLIDITPLNNTQTIDYNYKWVGLLQKLIEK